MSSGTVDVDYEQPPEESADGWSRTQTSRSLLPAALAGVAILLLWRYAGLRLLREGALQRGWLPLLLGGVLPGVFILAYPVWMIRRAGGRVFEGWPGFPRLLLEAAIAFGVLLMVYVVNVALAVLYTVFARRDPGVPEQFEQLVSAGDLGTVVVLAVMACIWAPIAEELFFRRFLLRALAGRMALAGAIVVQAFLFAILHDYGTFHLVLIFLLGVAMGCVYAWRRTIVTSMLLHALQNTGATLFLGLLVLLSRAGPDPGFQVERAERGCRVTSVEPGSAAAEAGLRAGDVITGIDGTAVQDAVTLRLLWVLRSRGSKVVLQIVRDGEPLTLEVRPTGGTTGEQQHETSEPHSDGSERAGLAP